MGLKNLFGAVSLESTQSDNRTILDMILNFMEDVVNSSARKDTNGRQCVRLELIDSGLTLSTISTVTAVSTVSTVGALNTLGAYSAQMIPFQATIPTHIYDRIVVS